MSVLEVPGARLYFETRGRGPTLLMVPGASGSADPFRPVAEHLAARYTVVTYDRRGFSRSRLEGPQDDARRLETDADDVRRLIEYVGDGPAIVFGASSGGIVALEALVRRPAVVDTLVPFEPPAVRLLPDGQRRLDFFAGLYDLYRRAGIEPALQGFRERAFAASDRQAMARAMDPQRGQQAVANATYWFEHELRQYPAADLDLGVLKAHADRIVPMAGRESRGYPAYEASAALARRLGRKLIELPGGHLGCVTHPAAFARAFVRALARRGAGRTPDGWRGSPAETAGRVRDPARRGLPPTREARRRRASWRPGGRAPRGVTRVTRDGDAAHFRRGGDRR